MKILAAGDSFVYGSELSDCDVIITTDDKVFAKDSLAEFGIYEYNWGLNAEHDSLLEEKYRKVQYSKKTFCALLSQAHEYICLAKPGISNDSISRRVIEFCQNQLKDVIVLVSWTFPGRYEFRFNYNTNQKESPWLSLTPWLVHDNITELYNDHTDSNSIDQIEDHEYAVVRAKQSGTFQFGKTFYKHVGGSEYWEVYNSLKEIVYLQNYLKINNIPYLFTCADNSIFYNYTVDHADSIISSLVSQIDQDNWFWFPPGKGFNETTTPRGFYQWAIENKYPIGTTHPLEDAHHDAAQLMKGKFDELVKKHMG